MRRAATAVALATSLAVAAPASAAAPNDPGYLQQWGLRAMRVADAWATSRGTNVVVAVIDTGVDAGHPDLGGRVLIGKDFVDDDDDAADTKGHGTHVAGTIAAAAGNGLGVASVAPGSKILPVRVLGTNGEGDPGDVAEGIRWSVEHGARIVNLSLAQDEVDGLAIGGESLLRDTRVDDAIKFAARAGALVVVASGNKDTGGRPETSYDATVPGVLVVGATTRHDTRAAYSNYGDGLDVVAPGGGSATDAKACAQGDWIVSTWWNPAAKRSDYGGGCGTSMAVAHVSGLGALLMARGLTNVQAAERIVSTAVDLGPKGRDAQTGHGRVDALAALGSPKVRVKGTEKPAAKPTPKAQAGSVAPTAPPTLRPGAKPEPTGIEYALVEPRPSSSQSRDVPLALAILLLGGVIFAHAKAASAFFKTPKGS